MIRTLADRERPGMQSTHDAEPVTDSTSKAEPLGAVRGLAVLLLTILGLFVRLFCLACKPFWFDEAFSVEMARVSWFNFLHLLWWREANMSLYYLFLRAWLHFGHTPFLIRSLSAVIATATIPAIYWLGSLLYSRRVALLAAALYTFNGYDIRYAQEARSYALFVLLGTLSSGFLIAFLRKPTSQNRAGHILFSVLAVYAHFYALLLIASQWLALRWVGKRTAIAEQQVGSATSWQVPLGELWRNWKVIGLAVAPILIFVAKTGAGPIRWIQRPGLLDLMRFSTYLTDGRPLIYFAACLLTLVPLGKNLFERTPSWEKWRVRFLLIWLLFPILLTVLLSFARPVFLPRYMIFCIPALLLLAAAGIGNVRPAWLSAVLTCAIVLLSADFVPFVYSHDLDEERDASIAAATLILDQSQPRDAVVFHIAETRIPYEFVRSQSSGQNTAIPSFAAALGPEIVFPYHGPGLDYRDFTGKPTAEFLRSALPSHSRVWVVLMNNGIAGKPDPTTVMLSQVLPEMFPTMQHWQFTKVEVRLYSRQ